MAEGSVRKEDLFPDGDYDPDNFHPPGSYGYVSGLHEFPKGMIWPTPQQAFQELRDSINAKRAPWDSNPWVCVVEFRRVEA